MPLATVIITSYNRPHLISGCIQSVLNQTMEDFELLIMDDGSNQETKDVILKTIDNRCRVFLDQPEANSDQRRHDPSIRYSININKGLEVAKGRYISYLCDDDYYFPERLEKLCGYMEEHQDVHVVFGKLRSRIFSSSNPNDRYAAVIPNDLPPDDIIEFRRDLEHLNPAFFKEGPDPENAFHCDHNMVIHRRECLNSINKPYWPESVSDSPVGDHMFFRKLAWAGYVFCGVDCWCVVKRYHSQNNRY